MNFALSEEQVQFGQSTREYLQSLGDIKLARKYADGEEQALKQVWDGLSKLGYMGLTVPEAYGGMGEGLISLVPVMEEMGRALVPGIYAETVALAVPLLVQYGTEEQKQKYLPAIASGQLSFTLAVTEPAPSGTLAVVDYAASGIQMSATRTSDGYLISGVKTLVPHGDTADVIILPVRTAKGDGEYGISLLLVERAQANPECKALNSFDQTRKLVELQFNEVKVPFSALLGPESGGWSLLQSAIQSLNVALCASLVGVMDKAVEMSIEYGNTRYQFGHPIGRFQAIKHRIVDMKLDLESARSLTYYAAWAVENQAEDRVAAVASARSFVTEAAIRVASHNIQNHGGMGFTWEFDCHLLVKRARALENYLGSPASYREQIAVGLGW